MNREHGIKWLFRGCVLLAALMAVYIVLIVSGHDPIAAIREQIRIAQAPDIERLDLSCSNSNNKVTVGESVSVSLVASPKGAVAPHAVYTSSDASIAEVDENGVVTGKALGIVTIYVTVDAGNGVETTLEQELTVRLPEPENVRVLCSEGGNSYAHLYWSNVDGAKGYHVYRQINGGQWQQITDSLLTKSKFTDVNTTDEGDHAYAVVAFAEEKEYRSKRSKTVMMSLPETPYGTKISALSDDGIEFYWKRPSGAEGYEVFRSYEEDSGYEKIADIPDRSIYTYLDSEFDESAKTVYYKVRSYTLDENERKVFSKISGVCTATYRKHLKLENQEVFLRSGNQRTLEAYLGWGNASNLRWTSSDSKVAKVNQKGTITAVSEGTCTITCYCRDNQEKRTCIVTVDRKALSKLSKLSPDYLQTDSGMWVQKETSEKDSAVLMMVGDMMCTGTQQAVQGYDTGDYNFNESFAGVKELISGADFAIGNLETMLSSSWPYMHEEAYIDNYANCNAPSRYLDAVCYAGFDAVVMSNNHNCDTGIQGTEETLEQVERYQLANTGMFRDDTDQRYLLVEVNGIKIGYLSYTAEETGFNDKSSNEWTEGDVETRLNLYQTEKARDDIAELRNAGAEYIIVYMHWGVKNVYEPTKNQQEDAQELANLGADYIVGSHSHLIQEYTVLTADDGRQVPCFYSLGDFQASIQQVAGNRDSVILRISLTRDQDGTVVLEDNAYNPCYTLTQYKGMYYYTIPISPEQNGGVRLSHFEKTHLRISQSVGTKLPEYKENVE